MSSVRAWLEPRIDPNEDLVQGCSERPVVHLAAGQRSEPLTLGRGKRTGIADLALRDRVVDILLCDEIDGEPALQATPLVSFSSARLHVNGNPIRMPPGQSMYLFSGDTLSLDNLRYEYKVHFKNASSRKRAFRHDPLLAFTPQKTKRDDPSSNPPAGTEVFDRFSGPSPAMSPLTVPSVEEEEEEKESGVKLSSDCAKRLSEEIQCSVCLEIEVHPRTLHPCGHTFCLICVAKLTQCPQCRHGIKSHTPARTLDNLISTLVGVPNMLPADDVEQYHTRKKQTDANIAKARSKPRPRKRLLTGATAYSMPPPLRAGFASHPSLGSISPYQASRQAPSVSAAVDLSWSASDIRRLARSQISAGIPFAPPALQPTVATSADRRFHGNQGSTQADAICIDD